MSIHIHIHTYPYTHIHTHTHTHIYIHIHTYPYTYTYTHIHTHTYTHTHISIYIVRSSGRLVVYTCGGVWSSGSLYVWPSGRLVVCLCGRMVRTKTNRKPERIPEWKTVSGHEYLKVKNTQALQNCERINFTFSFTRFSLFQLLPLFSLDFSLFHLNFHMCSLHFSLWLFSFSLFHFFTLSLFYHCICHSMFLDVVFPSLSP